MGSESAIPGRGHYVEVSDRKYVAYAQGDTDRIAQIDDETNGVSNMETIFRDGQWFIDDVRDELEGVLRDIYGLHT